MFDIDGIHNSQNDRIWAADRSATDIKSVLRQKRKFLQKVMFQLRVCSEDMSALVIFEDGTMYHDRHIKEVLPVAFKFGNNMFGTDWTFQQDIAKPHIYAKTQEWCAKHFPCLIDKCHRPPPPNSPDLNPLDYSIWDELDHQVNWDAVTCKTTLISELKCADRKVSPDVVFESYPPYTNRLYQFFQGEGSDLK